MKILMFVILFLLIGAFFIVSNENIALNSKANIDLFFSKYFDWAYDLVENGNKVTSYVVKMEWLPDTEG